MNPVHRRFVDALCRRGFVEAGPGRLKNAAHLIAVASAPSGNLSLVDVVEPGAVTAHRLNNALAANAETRFFRVLSDDGRLVRRTVLAPPEWLDDTCLDAELTALFDDRDGGPGPGVARVALLPVRDAALDESVIVRAAVAMFLLRRDHDAVDGVRHALPTAASSIWDTLLLGTSRERLLRRRDREAPTVRALAARPDAALHLTHTFAITFNREPEPIAQGEMKPC